jgi:iron complex transport system ATP-binding protein
VSFVVQCGNSPQAPSAAVFLRAEFRAPLVALDDVPIDPRQIWQHGQSPQAAYPAPSVQQLGAEEDAAAVIQVSNLTVLPVSQDKLGGRRSQSPILDRVSWTVLPREVWWVAGENGASKSALLSCAVDPDVLLELAQMQHRSRTWELEPDPDADRRRKRPPIVRCQGQVSMVSTELHIALLQSPEDPVVADLVRTTVQQLTQLCRMLGLDQGVAHRRFRELSLGEQKLVLIARALASRPKLLILDEAMQSLDAFHRQRVGRIIDAIASSPEFDAAVVIVTHHVDELPRVVTHRLFMVGGKIMSRGPWTGMAQAAK